MNFEKILIIAGQVLLGIAILAFAITSFIATFRGFQSFLPLEAAFVAALGLQATLTATGLFFAQAITFKQRSVAFASFLFALTLSVAFSYIGLREVFTINVAEKRKPTLESNEFREKRDELNTVALKIKGAIVNDLNTESIEIQTNGDIANQNEATRRVTAERLRGQIQAAQNRGSSQSEIRRLRRRLETAEASANSIAVDKARIGNEKSQLDLKKKRAAEYSPNFMGIATGDWGALQSEHQKLADIWGDMPQAFKTENGLPSAPSKRVLTAENKLDEGQDHPTIEALRSLEQPQSHERFALFLALLLDLVPFVAVMMTRPKGKPIYERLSQLRRWMRNVRVHVSLMDGIFAWLWNVITGFLFRGASASTDKRVRHFQKYLDQLRVEMQDFFDTANIPHGVAELLKVRLTDLYSKSYTIAFDSSSKLNEVVLGTYEACLDDINSDGLDANAKNRLQDFLNRHMEKFDLAVKNTNFAESANGSSNNKGAKI